MLGKNIDTVLKKWGMKQPVFAALFEDTTRHKISSYVRGASEPNIRFMIILGQITGISIRRLYEDELDLSDFPKTPILSGERPNDQKEIKASSSGMTMEERMSLMEKELAELKKKIE